jgi:hypothetical protein
MKVLSFLLVLSVMIVQLAVAQQKTTPPTYMPVNDAIFHSENEPNSFKLETKTEGWDHLTIISDSRIKDILEIQREESIRKRGFDGYRVQLYQGTKDGADKVKAKFLSLYPDHRVYDPFITPDFRVKVGDFRTRSEAISFKYKLIKDFPNPYIVVDVINFPDLE